MFGLLSSYSVVFTLLPCDAGIIVAISYDNNNYNYIPFVGTNSQKYLSSCNLYTYEDFSFVCIDFMVDLIYA